MKRKGLVEISSIVPLYSRIEICLLPRRKVLTSYLVLYPQVIQCMFVFVQGQVYPQRINKTGRKRTF